ncbi:MBL fold metallo-hydrolase [Tranquillimonas alkanivorans]|uniref:Glyoxylase, beta-lactamase superfamily II n=1 Tax=Tranquillimonas alkanivorans TaxID=441119 RepID=A0A1I5T1K4_9RHOB|nr:MBL fold metallo-hydrolase [Tranquillimonas alkanivorans]SFP76912.1 Glyoxylase, beta-lactamase superfamily II [Tranquillimonas alkanivorans]
MPLKTPMLTRRAALTAGAALPLAAATGGAAHAAAHEGAGPVMPQNTFKLGDFTVSNLLAGTRPVENPHSIFGLNVEDAEFQEVSRQNFIPADVAQFFFTPTLVDTGSEVVLFDTGLGAEGLTDAMARAGYTPEQVMTVVITHMHPDHVGGLMNAGNPTFENARHVTGQTEFDYWTSNPSEAVTANVVPIQDRFELIGDGASVTSGITGMNAFGHTPGHMVYMLESNGQQLLLMADTANHYVWSVGYPEWEVTFDMDKSQAARTRKDVLGMVASERIPLAGYHMPFPGIGFIEARDQGFRYVPETYQMMLNS